MKHIRPRLLLLMLAIASLATTALIAARILTTRPLVRTESTGDVIFDQGLALEDFTLTERNGKAFGSEQLDGNVWIVDFVFSRCAGVCPALSRRMADLQRELSTHPRWDQIRLVSITVDPEHDTPQVLRDYADSYSADPKHWLFLTGDRSTIWTLCTDGFKQTVSENSGDRLMPILHSQHFVLVDRLGDIRGFYDGMNDDELNTLRRNLDRLLNE